MPKYLFTANNSAGQPETDFIEAATLDGARYALETRRYSKIVFHTDDSSNLIDETIHREMGGHQPGEVLTPKQLLEARQGGGVLANLWSAWKMNTLFWLPLGLWALNSILGGTPYRWNDWLAFSLFGLFIVYFVWLVLPGIGYDRLLHASVWNDEAQTRLWVSTLRNLRRIGCPLIPAIELDVRLAHVLARNGKLEEMGTLMRKHEAAAEHDPMVVARIAGVFDSAGDHEKAHRMRTAFCEATNNSAMAVIDHAHGLARQLRRPDEAEASLKRIEDHEQGGVANLFIAYTRGLIALERGRHSEALAPLREAEAGTLQVQNPLMAGMRNDIRAFQAIALAGTGAREEARKIRAEVLPLLKARNDQALIQRLNSSV